tara:strand:- start:1429 stop:2130 length:702 start_codon:yes stop_codon:yes gene_type:complete
MAQIEDLITAYTLGSLSGIDTRKVGQNKEVNLKDPLVYDTYSAEDIPLPEGTEVIVEGSPINQREILVQTDQPTGFGKFLAGLRDLVSGNKYDYDRQDRIPLEDFQQREIVKQRRKADISGDAIPSPEKTRKSIETQRIQDDYNAERRRIERDEELKYLMAVYPKLADMINDEIAKRRYQAETTMPSELQKRFNSARSNYVGALLGRSQAQQNVANAIAMGLGRYSGIRNVAG